MELKPSNFEQENMKENDKTILDVQSAERTVFSSETPTEGQFAISLRFKTLPAPPVDECSPHVYINTALSMEELQQGSECEGQQSDTPPDLEANSGHIKKLRDEFSNPIAAADHQMQYSVQEAPPWYLSIILGFQHYVIMFGGTVSNPMIMAKAMCVDENNQSVIGELIGTIFFVSGLCTLLQTTFGVRLAIVQGGTFSFILSGLSILSLEEWNCPGNHGGFENSTSTNKSLNETLPIEDAWKPRMREIQGAIIVASTFQVIIGFTGVTGFLLRCIGPLCIAPTISLIGLSLFKVASDYASTHWLIAFGTIALVTLFSQYLERIEIRCFRYKRGTGCVRKDGFPLFRLFPVILSIAVMWTLCAILTATNVLSSDPNHPSHRASTNRNLHVVQEAAWFRIPYPGQWGMPTVSIAAVFGMFSAVLASMIESIGDYYACARMSKVSPPPIHAINRGIAMEGIGCVLAGWFGSGTGTTSYSENIGAIGITKVASRRVVQVGAIIMIIFGVLGKFGAVFVTIPQPIIGGIFTVMFGMVAAVGISNLQFVDLSSSRNLFIIGFSFFFGLAFPQYIQQNPSMVNTGSKTFDQILLVLLKTSMFVGGAVGFILDNTIPGTEEERGLIRWRNSLQSGSLGKMSPADVEARVRILEEQSRAVYDIPFITEYLRKRKWTKYVPIFPTFDEGIFSFRRFKGSKKNMEQCDVETTDL